MIVCLIAIALMLLATSFLCGYFFGARDNADILRVEGSVDAIEAIKKWIDERNGESGDAERRI